MPSMVIVPSNGHSKRRVWVDRVHSIISTRWKNDEEQFLVRWIADADPTKPPLSWHAVYELVRCLEHIQDYLDIRDQTNPFLEQSGNKKRKRPEDGLDVECRPSPIDRLQDDNSRATSISRSSSVAPAASTSVETYNGVLDTNEAGFLYCRHDPNGNTRQIMISALPTYEMILDASIAKVDTALDLIREAYVRRLRRVPGKAIHLINTIDSSTPSLRFRYIPDYVFDTKNGVSRASSETQQGCSQCSPQMGRSIGCEYTKKCDCLEYAAVDESRLTDPDTKAAYQKAMATGASTLGFPKKFPYFASGTKIAKTGCLVPFYLESRRAIYECNDKCNCGRYCRNKNVQFGRQVEIEIFRTDGGRGWGLRCRTDLHEGQFVDTYRGEVITDAEATKREEASSKAKASYLYSLDKFAESESIPEEDIRVVDGEFMGGPSKFMNHSCDPNCRQYTVSYNKHDPYIYDLAFFACRFIPAGEELTFDYLDKDECEIMDEPGEDAIPCLCESAKCRKWLWT
ncbi:SET domain-containing protein [Plenodomus tracheiphilus IPT5]|uniref:SET domain-containing protein n=1 Tax=Plenodomus tracheiphilus IPT5 TaxID=1408161 RepID=A0A6A7BP77_9PLEO|nr:SET domain-containing protein [Plenodomus tracheiphilus IPT5]